MNGGVIVVLATNDKEEMEEAINEQDIDLKGSVVICRSGIPTSTAGNIFFVNNIFYF